MTSAERALKIFITPFEFSWWLELLKINTLKDQITDRKRESCWEILILSIDEYCMLLSGNRCYFGLHPFLKLRVPNFSSGVQKDQQTELRSPTVGSKCWSSSVRTTFLHSVPAVLTSDNFAFRAIFLRGLHMQQHLRFVCVIVIAACLHGIIYFFANDSWGSDFLLRFMR